MRRRGAGRGGVADAAQQQVLKPTTDFGSVHRVLLRGKKRPAQGEEAVGHHAEGGMVVEASPRTQLTR